MNIASWLGELDQEKGDSPDSPPFRAEIRAKWFKYDYSPIPEHQFNIRSRSNSG